MRLQKNDGSTTFGKDASFKPVSGLVGKGISFQSSNFPDRYIRHQGFILKLHPSDKSALFNKDASFVAKPAFAKGAKNTLNTGETLKTGEKLISANNVFMAIMQTDGNLCVYDSKKVFKWGSYQNKRYSLGANYKLILTNAGKLNIVNPSGAVVWTN